MNIVRTCFTVSTALTFIGSVFMACAQPDFTVVPGEETGGSGGSSPTGSGGDGQTAGSGQQVGAGGSGQQGGSSVTGTGGDATEMDGSVGMGGSGMTTDAATSDAPIVSANPAQVLDNVRYEYPCGNCPTCFSSGTVTSCTTDQICWPNANHPHLVKYLPATTPLGSDTATQSWTFAGDPAKTYEVTIWLRGVMEPKDYINCTRLTPQATPDDIYVCNGPSTGAGAAQTAQGSTFNVYQLEFTDPPMRYMLNGNETHPGHRVNPIDQKFKVKIKGGSKAQFKMDDLNSGEIRNCNYIVAGVTNGPNNKAFDGNFFQLNVVDFKEVP